MSTDYRKILIIGSGAREHAIGWKINKDNPSAKLYFAPGNAGTQKIGENLKISDINELRTFALENKIDLTIVGPEKELVEGIVDIFNESNLPIFGPHQAAAKLEGDKAYAKDFMNKYGVKTAFSKTFKYYIDARDYVRTLKEYPIVIKASGIAAGKGVVIVNDDIEAETTLHAMMVEKKFGTAGETVVIEEYLKGFEVSILSIYNGEEIAPFLPVKDHKKIGEKEKGLNTGGMGVIAPNPLFSEEHFNSFVQSILLPTQKGLAQEKLPFAGVIFFGLMVTEKGIYLLEYNMRFGDPETEALLPLMENNLLLLIEQSLKGESVQLKWSEQHACCVVMASGGYPGDYEKGYEIRGLENVNCPLFIAGAETVGAKTVTSGGRVLNVVGLGKTLEEAKAQAYGNIKKIHFDYEYYRKDIGDV